jgi:hypothetical protein
VGIERSGRALPVGFERAVLHGTLFVATDGLLAYAPKSAVAESTCATTNLDEVARQLIDRLHLPSGDLMDDVALVLVRTPTVSRVRPSK